MKSLKALFVLALAVAFAVPAYAETQNIKVSGEIDAYWLDRANFDLKKNNDMGVVPASYAGSYAGGGAFAAGTPNYRSDSSNYFMGITQLEVAADLTDNVSTVINLVNQRDMNANQWVDPASATYATTPNNQANEFDILLDLAYVQMKEIFYSPLTLTIGRQDLMFGRGFIVGWNPSNPNNTIQATEFTALQSFDAVRATLDFNPWTIDLVYSKIYENAVNSEDDKDLYIANVNYKFAEYNAVAEGYYVGELDRAALASTSTSVGSNDTHTLGGRVQFDPISQITLGAELAYEFGNYRPASTSPHRDRSAWATDIFGEYHWDYTWKPMLGLEYVLFSGESDLAASSTSSYGSWNGNYSSPTYGWIHQYLETYYGTAQPNDQNAAQNIQIINVYGTLKPMEDLILGANFYYYWAAADMHVVTTNPNSSTLSRDIGYEIDTSITYNYTENVSFNLMMDWFVPGNLYSSGNDAIASQYVSSVKVTF